MADDRATLLVADLVASNVRVYEAAKAERLANKAHASAKLQLEQAKEGFEIAWGALKAHLTASVPYVYDAERDEYVSRDGHG